MIVDCALYAAGHRLDLPPTLDSLAKIPEHPGAFGWLGFRMPNADELGRAVETLGHPDDIEIDEVLAPHTRPVLSIEGSALQIVLRTAQYVDRDETISLGELTLIVWNNAIISVRYGQASPLAYLRSELELEPERLAHGPLAVMAAIIEQVVADYSPALDGFEHDVIEVERDVFSDSGTQPVRRLYRLKREVRLFQSPLEALDEPLERLIRHVRRQADAESLETLMETSDKLGRTIARTRSLSNLLDAALTASLAQTGIQQNEDMRKISAWVAMAAVPTMVAGIYGMNFEHMPELRSSVGYPLTLIGMGGVVLFMYRVFKRSGWL
ncbi:MAG: magnesium and cobalt transport protein CorA [Actinomycetia bacterium]|nr:magnesium and cobalt transport protein CorA [Actinomycetes bacterium]